MAGVSVWLPGTIALALAGAPALAAEFGSAEDAKAMLERAVASLKDDKEAALAAFSAGQPEWRDRDLYVFCVDVEENVFTAHGADPGLVGQTPPTLVNSAGESVDDEMRTAAMAAEGEFAEVEYVWPRPGETEPSEKVAYMARVDDQICGVGHYK